MLRLFYGQYNLHVHIIEHMIPALTLYTAVVKSLVTIGSMVEE